MIRAALASLFLLAGCATTDHASAPKAVDSFCAAYQRVIIGAGDSAEVAKTSATVKRRIARNDVLYRCRCEGWQNAACPKE